MQNLLDNKRVADIVGVSRTVVSVSYEDTISDALKKLESAHVFGGVVHSGPVTVGLIDMEDIVRSLMKFTRTSMKDFSSESTKNLKDVSKMFSQQVVGGILSTENQLERVTRNASVYEAITKMLDEGVRRLVVVDELGKTVNIITQFDVVKFLNEHIDEFGDACKQSVGALSLGNSPVICASLTQCAAEVFQMMISENVRGVAITNKPDDGEVDELVANLSLSDLKGLNEENFENLSKNVFEFILATQDAPKSVISCTNATSLQDVFQMMVDNAIHRIYTVDSCMRPSSVISVVDLLNYAVQVL